MKADQQLVFYSEDLEIDDVVEYSQPENIWLAVIDWDEIREIELDEENLTQERYKNGKSLSCY